MKGFTLIEVIVTIVVLSLLASGAIYILLGGIEIWVENRNFAELRADGHYFLSRLTAEAREATSFTLNNSTYITFTSDIYDEGYDGYHEIEYKLDDTIATDLIRNEVSSSFGLSDWRIMCRNVSALNFSWNNPVLTVDLTLLKDGDQVNLRTHITSRCVP